jgi:hypothetical protein
MTNPSQTTFTSKCEILGEFWIGYKHSDTYYDFVSYNDLGLPLAYALSQDIVSESPQAEGFIDETFEMFMNVMETEDIGYESLDEILPFGED